MDSKNIYINFVIIMSLILALSICGFSGIRAYELKAIMTIADESVFLKKMYQDQIMAIVMGAGITVCQVMVFYLSQKILKKKC